MTEWSDSWDGVIVHCAQVWSRLVQDELYWQIHAAAIAFFACSTEFMWDEWAKIALLYLDNKFSI